MLLISVDLRRYKAGMVSGLGLVNAASNGLKYMLALRSS